MLQLEGSTRTLGEKKKLQAKLQRSRSKLLIPQMLYREGPPRPRLHHSKDYDRARFCG